MANVQTDVHVETQRHTRAQDGLALTWTPVAGAIRYGFIVGFADMPVPPIDALMKGATKDFAILGIPARYSGAVDLGSPVGEERQYGLIAYRSDGSIVAVSGVRFSGARSAPRDREYHALQPPALVRSAPLPVSVSAPVAIASSRGEQTETVDPWAALGAAPRDDRSATAAAPPFIPPRETAASAPPVSSAPPADPWEALGPPSRDAVTPAEHPAAAFAAPPAPTAPEKAAPTAHDEGPSAPPAARTVEQAPVTLAVPPPVPQPSDPWDVLAAPAEAKAPPMETPSLSIPPSDTGPAPTPVSARPPAAAAPFDPWDVLSPTFEAPASSSLVEAPGVEDVPVPPAPVAARPPEPAPRPMIEAKPREIAVARTDDEPSPPRQVQREWQAVPEQPLAMPSAPREQVVAAPASLSEPLVARLEAPQASIPVAASAPAQLVLEELDSVTGAPSALPVAPESASRPASAEPEPSALPRPAVAAASHSEAPPAIVTPEGVGRISLLPDAPRREVVVAPVREEAPPPDVAVTPPPIASKLSTPPDIRPAAPAEQEAPRDAHLSAPPTRAPGEEPGAGEQDAPSTPPEEPAFASLVEEVYAREYTASPADVTPTALPVEPVVAAFPTPPPTPREDTVAAPLDPIQLTRVATLLDEAELYLLPSWLDYAEAGRLVAEAAAIAPDDPRVRETQAQLQAAQGSESSDASDDAPDAAVVAMLEGARRALAGQDYWQAVDLYEQALARQGDNVEAREGARRARVLARWSAQLSSAGTDAKRLQSVGDLFADDAPDLAAQAYAAAFAARPRIATLQSLLTSLAGAAQWAAVVQAARQGVDTLQRDGVIQADAGRDDAIAALLRIPEGWTPDAIEGAAVVDRFARALAASERGE